MLISAHRSSRSGTHIRKPENQTRLKKTASHNKTKTMRNLSNLEITG